MMAPFDRDASRAELRNFSAWRTGSVRRAPARPYFLRSTTRLSRVRKPGLLSAARRPGSNWSAPWRCRDAPRRPGPTGRRRRRWRRRRTGRPLGDVERLLDHHAQHGTCEIDRLVLAVDGDLAGARLHPDAGDGVLALAGGIGAALSVELLVVDGGGGLRAGRSRAGLLQFGERVKAQPC